MDKPQVDRIDGIPPAIAIDQTNPVRTSRSTVGTMTELNDHLKLLFARAAALFCRCCGQPVRRDTPRASTPTSARAPRAPAIRACSSASRCRCRRTSRAEEVRELLARQGYTRFCDAPAATAAAVPAAPAARGRKRTRSAKARPALTLHVVQDRLRLGGAERGRVLESLEAALRVGRGRVDVQVVDEADPPQRSTPGATRASCTAPTATCRTASRPRASSRSTRRSAPATPAAASAASSASTTASSSRTRPSRCAAAPSSPGRPSPTPSARTTWRSSRSSAASRCDTPWRELSAEARNWVIEGEGAWTQARSGTASSASSPGSRRSAYKMHVRVLLSHYRSYTPAPPAAARA